jgi:type II secretion system protein D
LDIVADSVDDEVGEMQVASSQPNDGVPNPASQTPAPSGDGKQLIASNINIQVIPDVRTNRILVIAPEGKIDYLRKLILDLDLAVTMDPPLEWPLRFVSADKVLPVLQSILAEGEEADKQTGQNGQQQNNGSSNNESSFESSNSGSSSGSNGDSATLADKLKSPKEESNPIAVSVGKVRIIADPASNKIIVIGPPEARTKAADVLKMLDQRPKQIYLATVIGQLTLGKGLDLGVQYPASIPLTFGTVNNAVNNNNGTSTSTGANAPIVNNNGVDVVPGTQQLVNAAAQIATTRALPLLSGLTIYGVLGDSIDIRLKALQSTNRFKVISRPVVYTANNKKAVISSGQEVPVPADTLTSSSSVAVQGASISTSIQYKSVVLKLEVIPLINSNNEVTLQIAQQNNSLDGSVTIANNTVPQISTQELTTTVTVPNRHTVVLGGLITEQNESTKSGIPLLSNIPVVGFLFGQTSKTVTRKELIIMIQPFIVNSPEDETEVNQIEKSMSSFTEEERFEKPPALKGLAPMTFG